MPSTFKDLINIFLNILGAIFPVIFVLAWLVFFWGLAKFIFQAGDPKSHEAGKAIMIWGLISIFVMVSLMAILSFFSGEFGFGPVGIPKLPT